MANVGWWASDRPLCMAVGRRFRTKGQHSQPLLVPTDHRLRHTYIVGSSGSGKSRWAQFVLQQDVDCNRGLTLVDPHDLQRDLLAYIAQMALPGELNDDARQRLGDKLIILDPTDQRWGAPGINLLQVAPGQDGYQLVDAIIETIRELWPDCFGPRLEDVCRNSLLLLQELDLTVLEMMPLLSDGRFRQALVDRSQNQAVKLYFQEHLGGLRASEVKTWFESSRNKWSAFLANPYIRPILGQTRSTISFRKILDEGKWLIVNVSRDKLKESRRLLGALIVTLLHQAAISREDTPPDGRIFHALLVDEFQEFWTPTFLHILEGARKYGLALTMCHQNLTQPPFDERPAIVDTILANTSTRLCFTVSRMDAERLAGEMFHATGREVKHQRTWLFGIPTEEPKTWSISDEKSHYADELMRQRRGEVYVSLRGIGDDEPYYGMVPYVPDVPPVTKKVEALRRHVAAKYYRPLADIEREIEQRWARIRSGPTANVRVRRDWFR